MGTIALPRRRPAMHRGVAMILHWLLQKLSAKAFFRSCSSCDVVNPTLQIRRIGRRNAVALSSPMRPITADAPVSDVRHQHQSYTTIFNHCDIIGLKICRILWKKRKIRAITALTSFKIIEVGTNRKPVCDLLLVINSN